MRNSESAFHRSAQRGRLASELNRYAVFRAEKCWEAPRAVRSKVGRNTSFKLEVGYSSNRKSKPKYTP
jgi:hypothetical protein